MKKTSLRILSLAILLMLVMTSLPAMAAENNGQIDITIGSVKSLFDRNGIHLKAYLVATGEYGRWETLSTFADIQLFSSQDDGSAWVNKSLAQLHTTIQNQGLQATQEGISQNGKISFKSLRHGIYYIEFARGPENLDVKPLLLAVPDRTGRISYNTNAKLEFNPPVPPIDVPHRRNEHLVPIDDYETALGLGNIQMHVGVCFE